MNNEVYSRALLVRLCATTTRNHCYSLADSRYKVKDQRLSAFESVRYDWSALIVASQLYQPLPLSAIIMPTPLIKPTGTSHAIAPKSIVSDCFRLAHTISVRAPATLFVWKERMFCKVARSMLKRIKPMGGIEIADTKAGKSCRLRDISPARKAKTQEINAAGGLIRSNTSSGCNSQPAFINLFVATV